MKLRMLSAVVSSALITGLAIAPAIARRHTHNTQIAQATTDTTTTTVVTTDSGAMNNGMDMGNGMDVGMDYTGDITRFGVTGTWVPGVDEPVVPGLVISNDIMTDRAVVKTPYGFVPVHTGAGISVLYNDKFVGWTGIEPGEIVQLPMSVLINGPVPHRLTPDRHWMRMMGNMNMNNGQMTSGPMAGGTMSGTGMGTTSPTPGH